MKKTILFFIFTLLLWVPSQAQETIEWWHFWTNPEIKPTIEQMVADFEAANPGIKVNMTDLTWANGHEKIAIALASGKGPDVLELGSDWIAQFADSDQLTDLSEIKPLDTAKFTGWGMARYQGKIYAHPWILGTRVLFANRALLKRAGYAKNWAPITWVEFKQACLDINRLGKNIYGWGSNTAEKHRLYKKYLPFFWSSKAQIFSDKNHFCVVASERAVEALDFYKELHDSCGYVANQRGIEDAFLDGKVGFILSGDWLLKRIDSEKRSIDFATYIFPGPFRRVLTQFPGTSFLGGEFLAIPKASNKKETALKLIEFITSAENQLKFCKANFSACPSSKVAQQDDYFTKDEHLLTFVRQMALSKHPPVDPDWVYIEGEIEHAVEDALFGRGLTATALYEAGKKIEALENK